MMWYFAAFCLLAVNGFAFLLFGIDKLKAKRGSSRIAESTLLAVVFAGGGVGALAGMRVWRHKTLHAKFRYGVPLIVAAQALLCVWVMWRA